MADVLNLEQARSALGWRTGQNPERDAEILELYIPATTGIVEDLIGSTIESRIERWVMTITVDGEVVTTPWPVATVTAVRVDGEWVTGWSIDAGDLTLAKRHSAGSLVMVMATNLPTPAPMILAAKIILAQLWNADKQGRSASSVRGEGETVPVGFAVPRRAEALLEPYTLGALP